MKFMLTFHIKPGGQGPRRGDCAVRENRRAAAEGRQAGDDAAALTAFSLMWSDLMELRLVPMIEDPQLVEVLRAA